jgi:hypothetical protein
VHHNRRGRKSRVLLGMLLLAIAYGAALQVRRTLLGTHMADGALGVALGLYICSHPAANAIDVWFYERRALGQVSSTWTGALWLALNVLVVAAGWAVIVLGTTRLVAGAAS